MSDPNINEMMVCQAKALIRELWPDEFDVKPDLRLVQVEPVKEERISAQEEAVYMTVREMLRERWGARKPKLTLIQGGRTS